MDHMTNKKKLLIALGILAVIILVVVIIACTQNARDKNAAVPEASSENQAVALEEETTAPATTKASVPETAESETAEPETTLTAAEAAIEEAAAFAIQYDYDAAIECLSDSSIASDSQVEARLAEYNEIKEKLVKQNLIEIPHVFFHSLVVDTSLAFDGDYMQDGYNQVMTTVTEFKRVLEQMYERGYVLVSLHDISKEIKDEETGEMRMIYTNIRLPEGKKAFVMSQDDLCYYEYQKGDGLATRMIVGEDGRPTCEYTNTDGSISVGAYDLVPILDEFIDEHPDFSYKGAKAVLAFTGYNGILGYRTDESYDPDSEYYDSSLKDAPNENLEADRQEAVKVLKALVDDGYELSSHSWGHLDMDKIDMDRFTLDAERWDRNVGSLIREATGNDCDILIYPKGSDIGHWSGYARDAINTDGLHPDGYEKFCLLHNYGFRYYCSVDSTQNYVQKGNDYFRMSRRNIDGDRMWRDMQEPETARLTDFIDVATVFDSDRPTPVPSY